MFDLEKKYGMHLLNFSQFRSHDLSTQMTMNFRFESLQQNFSGLQGSKRYKRNGKPYFNNNEMLYSPTGGKFGRLCAGNRVKNRGGFLKSQIYIYIAYYIELLYSTTN